MITKTHMQINETEKDPNMSADDYSHLLVDKNTTTNLWGSTASLKNGAGMIKLDPHPSPCTKPTPDRSNISVLDSRL